MGDTISSNIETVNKPILTGDFTAVQSAIAAKQAQVNAISTQASEIATQAATALSFSKKTWTDTASSGTPITAADLNRLETACNNLTTAVNNLQDSVSYSTKVTSSDTSYTAYYCPLKPNSFIILNCCATNNRTVGTSIMLTDIFMSTCISPATCMIAVYGVEPNLYTANAYYDSSTSSIYVKSRSQYDIAIVICV